MDKVVSTAADAVADIPDGATASQAVCPTCRVLTDANAGADLAPTIDELALQILATRQPVASDLRFITMALPDGARGVLVAAILAAGA